MIAAIKQYRLNIYQGIASNYTAFHSLSDAPLNCGNILLRYSGSPKLVTELESTTALPRLQLDPNMTILSVSTNLLYKPAFNSHRLCYGLLVSNLWFPPLRFNPIIRRHTIHNNLKVKLAHA